MLRSVGFGLAAEGLPNNAMEPSARELPLPRRGSSRTSRQQSIVSIYSTLWKLQFPRDGDAYSGCDWVEVLAQGVPAHVGTPTPGYGYESDDPYASFLPQAVRIGAEASEDDLRAVVFVAEASPKGTSRSGQEYAQPLLLLSGAEYTAMPFQVLHDRLCNALRGAKPRLVLEVIDAQDGRTLVFENGSTEAVADDEEQK